MKIAEIECLARIPRLLFKKSHSKSLGPIYNTLAQNEINTEQHKIKIFNGKITKTNNFISLNARPGLVKHRKQCSSGNGMRCSGQNTKMHTVTRYNRRRHIALLSHDPPNPNSQLSIFTPGI